MLRNSGRAYSQRVEHLIESRPKLLSLDPIDAAALDDLGKRLASTKSFWGGAEDETGAEPTRTVIRCVSRGGDSYEVTVINAVGLVSIRGLQIEVHPKIELSHFLYLLRKGDVLPRTVTHTTTAAADTTLWDLVARWYVETLETVLRRGLLSDYRSESDLLQVARGQVLPVETAGAYYGGRVGVMCEYDEFDEDMPLNRVLLAAARAIVESAQLEESTRRAASTSSARLDRVGPLRSGDLSARTDRRSEYYRDALILAHHILDGTGRSISAGPELARSFLIRTPEMVEAGVRSILAAALSDTVEVVKVGRQLQGVRLTFNPDLIFGSVAVGDVKYKQASNEWNRPDLYQAIAFATAVRVARAAIVTFGAADEGGPPPALSVGDIELRTFRWTTDPGISPSVAADELAREVRQWIVSAMT